MKRTTTYALYGLGALALVGIMSVVTGLLPHTAREKIDPGYVGLKLNLYGRNKGIQNAKLVTGRVWYDRYTQDVIEFPTFINTYPFTANETEGSVNNESVNFAVAGSPVSADVGLSFGYSTDTIDGEYTKVHRYYKTYRKDPELFLRTNMYNGLRDCFSRSAENLKLSPTDLPTSQQKLTTAVSECLSSKFPDVKVTEVSLLSPLRLEKKIQERITEQFAAQQAAQTAEFNEKKAVAEARAERAKAKGEAEAMIERARGQAEADRLRTQNITPELIRLKEIEMQMEEVKRWDGKRAVTVQTPNVQLGTGE